MNRPYPQSCSVLGVIFELSLDYLPLDAFKLFGFTTFTFPLVFLSVLNDACMCAIVVFCSRG